MQHPATLVDDDGVTVRTDGLEMVGTVIGNGGKRPGGRFSALPFAGIRDLNTTEEVTVSQAACRSRERHLSYYRGR